MALHYLTLQDMIWINLQVAKKTEPFDYASLEEATFHQYAYGDSLSLLSQAARFVVRFAGAKPFASGNEETALIACLAFLAINGQEIGADRDQVWAWFGKIERGEGAGEFADLALRDGPISHAPVADVRGAVGAILRRFGSDAAAVA